MARARASSLSCRVCGGRLQSWRPRDVTPLDTERREGEEGERLHGPAPRTRSRRAPRAPARAHSALRARPHARTRRILCASTRRTSRASDPMHSVRSQTHFLCPISSLRFGFVVPNHNYTYTKVTTMNRICYGFFPRACLA